MRFSKSLFVAFAGLGLFACSNEDVTNGNGTINGPADVVVKLDLPNMSTGRALVDGGFTTNTEVTPGYVKITLACEDGPKVIEGNYSEKGTNGKFTFTGVNAPTSVTVELNTKTSSGESWTDVAHSSLTELQNIAVANTRMTGSTNEITASGDKYTCTVDMEHTMARLEFGGIKHETHASEDKCLFKAGELSGIMLNKVKLNEANEQAKTYNEAEIDAMFGADGTATPWDKITGTNFLNGATEFPEAGKSYSYNIYPAEGATNLPVLTLYFTGLESADNLPADAPVYVGTNGFASVAKYKIAEANYNSLTEKAKKALCGESAQATNGFYQVINFPAGYIYQVKSLSVADEDIKTTPDGSGLTLEATINVTAWTIAEGSVEWN